MWPSAVPIGTTATGPPPVAAARWSSRPQTFEQGFTAEDWRGLVTSDLRRSPVAAGRRSRERPADHRLRKQRRPVGVQCRRAGRRPLPAPHHLLGGAQRDGRRRGPQPLRPPAPTSPWPPTWCIRTSTTCPTRPTAPGPTGTVAGRIPGSWTRPGTPGSSRRLEAAPPRSPDRRSPLFGPPRGRAVEQAESRRPRRQRYAGVSPYLSSRAWSSQAAAPCRRRWPRRRCQEQRRSTRGSGDSP